MKNRFNFHTQEQEVVIYRVWRKHQLSNKGEWTKTFHWFLFESNAIEACKIFNKMKGQYVYEVRPMSVTHDTLHELIND